MTIYTSGRDTASPLELANIRWADAVRVYRSSIDLYHKAMALRLKREAQTQRAPVEQLPAAFMPPMQTRPPVSTLPTLTELTPREREVAGLIASGYTNQQIAEMLVLTRGTVANHVAHILYKLGVTNRTQVAALVHQHSSRPGST